MKQIGLGVMFRILSGNKETTAAINKSIGKVIESVKLDDNKLVFKFDDDSGLMVYDGGQSCCEYRYMVTADNLDDYIGEMLLGFEVKSAPDMDGGCEDVHEVQFLDVITNMGGFQIANHNEHSGRYGGFCIVAELINNE